MLVKVLLKGYCLKAVDNPEISDVIVSPIAKTIKYYLNNALKLLAKIAMNGKPS